MQVRIFGPVYLHTRLLLRYHRKDKYRNYQRKSTKSALVTKEDSIVNTWAGLAMVVKETYIFNPIFLKKYDAKWKNCRD